MRLLLLLMFPSLAFAWDWANPNSLFDATKTETNQANIRWVVVNDIDKHCKMENKKRGASISYTVDGCQYYENNQCVIATAKKTSIHIVGHEVLHCFKGAYH
jgi:hypothetical protein